MTTEKQLNIPTVGDYVRREGRLKKVFEYQPPPPPPVTYYIFEQIEARGEMRLKGNRIDNLGTTTDFYGEDTSVINAIIDAKKCAKKYGITAQSDVEIVVIKIITLRAKVVVQGAINFINREMVAFGCDNYLPPTMHSYLGEPVEELVWSSKKDSLEIEQ